MYKSQIKNLSTIEKQKLSIERKKNGSYTSEALFAQELLWEESWASLKIINEQNPFDYEPYSIED